MIPLIGIMIGVYIIARTLFLFIQENTPLALKFVAFFCTAYLFISGLHLQDIHRELAENWRNILK